jgi:hypothetical protein
MDLIHARIVKHLCRMRKEFVKMAEKIVDKKKRLVLGGLLFAAAVTSLLGGMPGSSSHSNSMVSVAYADDCDGPKQPPDLDCPLRPTPTPTH